MIPRQMPKPERPGRTALARGTGAKVNHRQPTARPDQRSSPSGVLTEAEAAHYIGLSVHFLRVTRLSKPRAHGPDFLQFGRAIRYRLADLDRWMTQNVRRREFDPRSPSRPAAAIHDPPPGARPASVCQTCGVPHACGADECFACYFRRTNPPASRSTWEGEEP